MGAGAAGHGAHQDGAHQDGAHEDGAHEDGAHEHRGPSQRPDTSRPRSPTASDRVGPASGVLTTSTIPSGRALALVLFVISGAVGLAYEVLWSRLLLLDLGSTAASSALVLGLFVAGLGLGARFGGHRAAQLARPLRLYAVVEALAALWALIGLGLLGVVGEPFAAVARALGPSGAVVARVALAALIVLPGATLLGATLPAGVASWSAARGQGARSTAWLYGANSLGAVVGALVTGWYAIGALGVDGSVFAAAGCGLVLAGVAWLTAPTVEPEASRLPQDLASTAPAATPLDLRHALGVALALGALGLAIEIVGFRVLVFFVEGFTASLASMLAVFIAGLAVGSLVLGPPLLRTRSPLRVLGVLLLVEVAVLAVVIGVVVQRLDGWMDAVRATAFATATDAVEVAAAARWASLVGSAALLFVPAFVLGPTFPLAVSLVERTGLGPARAVGATYLANAAGSVLGPVAITFVLVPWTGVAGAGITVGVAAAVLAACLLRGGAAARAAPLALVGAALLCAVIVPAEGTTASLLGHTHVLRAKEAGGERRLLAVASDAVTTASVIETAEGERILYTDDFAAAATGRHYRYMRLLGILPTLLARRAEHVMVIAFGTGTTAGAIATLEEPTRIEIVEVSDAVLELAPWFEDVHRGVLRDKRVVARREDGRHALLLHAPDLDVITLEPLMPYSPAGLPLYTKELYELARDRLREGGVLCQWVPVHAMPAPLYAAFVRTFFEVFPDGDLWFFEQSTVLVARKGEGPDAATFERRREQAMADLRAAGVDRPERLALAHVAHGRDVLAAPVPPAQGPLDAHRTVRDRDPYPEMFPTPRARLRTPYLAATLQYLATLVEIDKKPTSAVWWPAEDAGLREATRDMLVARWAEARADLMGTRAPDGADPVAWLQQVMQTLGEASDLYRRALVVVPDEPVLLTRRARTLRLQALVHASAPVGPDPERARAERIRLLAAALPPALPDTDADASLRGPVLRALARALLEAGRYDSACRVLRLHLEAWPDAGARTGRDALSRLLVAADEVRRLPQRGTARVQDVLGGDDLPPPGPDGMDLLAEDVARFTAASAGAARFTAARRLADRAEALLLRDDLLAWIRGSGRSVDVDPALAQAWIERLTPRATTLATHLAAAEGGGARRALLEAFDGLDLLPRQPEVLPALLEDDDAALRQAAVLAAGRLGRREHLARLAERLLDVEPAVRRAAAGALFPHVGDLIEGYDPAGTPEAREAIAARVRSRFAAPR